MGGRKKPDMTENEREHEYVLHQLVERGEKLVGDEAAFLDNAGAVGDVRRQRLAWWEDRHDRHREEARRRR